jgi:sugar lactone lactonase YvrE
MALKPIEERTMKPTVTVLAFAFALISCTPAQPPAAETSKGPVSLASFAAPTFLENLTVAADGAILFTNYTGKTVERLPAGGGAVEAFVPIDVHPVSIVPLGEGFLVAAHATPFTAGPSFLGTGVLVSLDGAGKETARTPVPQAGFLNGMVTAPDGAILIADSAKAQILRFDPQTRTISVWFADPVLAPSAEPFLPGANGLKLEDGVLMVSSSATRTLYQIALSPNGLPQGPMTPFVANLPGADDFVVLPEGGFAVATHGDRIIRVALDGAVTPITDDPRVRGATAVALAGEGADRRLVILGTGGFSEGLGQPAVVLAVPFPAP